LTFAAIQNNHSIRKKKQTCYFSRYWWSERSLGILGNLGNDWVIRPQGGSITLTGKVKASL